MFLGVFVFSFCLVCIHGGSEAESLCQSHYVESKSVIDFCVSQNGTFQSRCCLSSNSSDIIAIDLTDGNFDHVPDFTSFSHLNMIDLRQNSQLRSSPDKDFLGLLSLNYLFLPSQFSCPGDKRVWQVINQTIGPSGVLCMQQKDLCTNTTDMCVSSHASCASNGPNHFLCLCKNGYYGYKCLRDGQFPVATFFGTVTAITVVLSTVFYYSQRRNVR